MAGRAKEFKDSAVQSALNSEKSVLQIAKELPMHEKTLYSWLAAHRKNHINYALLMALKKVSSRS